MVAGARGMMRYRRNRASTMEGAANSNGGAHPAGSQMLPQQQHQQQLLPSSIGYGAGASASGAPWTAMYQGGNSAMKTTSGAVSGVGASSGLMGAAASGGRGVGGSGNGGGGPPSNWGISYGSNAVNANNDGRPKSANFNAGQPTATSNSLMASLTGAGRPSSSVQPSQVPLSTNWSSQQQQQQSQSGQQQQQQLSINNNSNTLSYGSLKNRFLSGTGGKSNMPSSSSNNNVGGASAAAAGAGSKSSSKLFSLAR